MQDLHYRLLEMISESKVNSQLLTEPSNLGSDFIHVPYKEISHAEDHIRLAGYIIPHESGEYFILTDLGKEIFAKENDSRKNKENIESLQIEKLVSEVNKFRQEFSDYPGTKSNAKWAIRLSGATIIVTIVLQIIEWKCKG